MYRSEDIYIEAFEYFGLGVIRKRIYVRGEVEFVEEKCENNTLFVLPINEKSE